MKLPWKRDDANPRLRLPTLRRERPAGVAARDAAEAILAPYARSRRRLTVIWLLLLTCVACFGYGYGFSVFAPFRIVQFGFPILIMGAISVWALPELGSAPTKAMERLFFISFICLPLWPPYLAIALPGLPWITLVRLTGFPLTFLLLVAVSSSRAFRNEASEPLRGSPALWKAVVIFAVYQALSVGLSNKPQISIDKLLIALISWTAVFFLSAWVFSKPGRIGRWTVILWAIAVFLSLLTVPEVRLGRVLWAGHIPSFLAVQDDSVARAMGAKMRAGTDRYRAQATFSSPLGLGEFLALSTPFIIHYAAGPYRFITKVLAGLSIPIILFGIIMTDSRLGFVGFLIGCVLYAFSWGVLQWRQHKGSIVGPAIVLSYPVIFMAFIGAILSVQRLRVMTLGGDKHAASNEARAEQVAAGIPMVLKHPFGFGIGRGAEALGFTNSGGVMTIDTYYLLIAMDYGIVGFLLFYGTFIVAIVSSARGILMGPKDKEQTQLIPLGIALVSFVVIKSIYSGVENQSTVFMMVGAIAALIYRVKVANGLMPARAGSAPSRAPRS